VSFAFDEMIRNSTKFRRNLGKLPITKRTFEELPNFIHGTRVPWKEVELDLSAFEVITGGCDSNNRQRLELEKETVDKIGIVLNEVKFLHLRLTDADKIRDLRAVRRFAFVVLRNCHSLISLQVRHTLIILHLV
jgi:hypothetical protein